MIRIWDVLTRKVLTDLEFFLAVWPYIIGSISIAISISIVIDLYKRNR